MNKQDVWTYIGRLEDFKDISLTCSVCPIEIMYLRKIHIVLADSPFNNFF